MTTVSEIVEPTAVSHRQFLDGSLVIDGDGVHWAPQTSKAIRSLLADILTDAPVQAIIKISPDDGSETRYLHGTVIGITNNHGTDLLFLGSVLGAVPVPFSDVVGVSL